MCALMYASGLCVQPSTIPVELPASGFLDPGALPANLVAATAPAEGVLTDTNPWQQFRENRMKPKRRHLVRLRGVSSSVCFHSLFVLASVCVGAFVCVCVCVCGRVYECV